MVLRIDGLFALWVGDSQCVGIFLTGVFYRIRSLVFFHLLILMACHVFSFSAGFGHFHRHSALSFVFGRRVFLHCIYYLCNSGARYRLLYGLGLVGIEYCLVEFVSVSWLLP